MPDCQFLVQSRGTWRVTDHGDADLLKKVAEGHDRSAFNELFSRYQDSAYSLAWHILQNAALAEEAVQEAMLAIWLSPRTDFNAREPREWILGTVAGKCLNIRRSQRKQSRREKAVMQRTAAAALPSNNLEDEELLTALRQHISRLPEQDSALLACSFGTNLSHQKIGEMMGIPKSTITLRIQQALQSLRLSLQQNGFAALVPLATTEAIHQALTSGKTCPPGLISTFHTPRAHSSNSSARIKRARRNLRRERTSNYSWFTGAAVVTVCALVAGIALVQTADSPPMKAPLPTDSISTAAPAPIPAPPLPVTMSSTPTAAPTPVKTYREWTFDKEPGDLKPLVGAWQWKASGNTGYMLTADSTLTAVMLPVEISARPFKVSITKMPHRGKDLNVKASVLRSNGKDGFAFEYWSRNETYKQENRSETMTCIFDGKYCLYYGEQGLGAIEKYNAPCLGNRFCLLLKNVKLQRVLVESIEPSELPSDFKNIEDVIARFTARGCDHGMNQ